MAATSSHEERVASQMEQFREFLVKKQLKSTRQRDVIARTFFATEDHITIEELLALSREENPRIGYATVYRTLKLLTECGLAEHRRFGDGQAVYEAADEDEHHDHLICMECNHVLEFEDELIERQQEKVARSFGFTLVKHKLELYGLCAKASGIRGGTCPREDKKKPARRAKH